MTPDTAQPEDLTFSAALTELEEIVRALETGQLGLEESLALYERGVVLLRTCQAKLADAQQKVTMLIGELEADEGAQCEEPQAEREEDPT